MALVGIRRSPRRPITRLSRRTPTLRPVAKGEEPTYEEIAEMLSEAAHLVSQASRKLRYAQQNQAGFALHGIVDEIHEHIRNLPSSIVEPAPTHRHRRNHRCDS